MPAPIRPLLASLSFAVCGAAVQAADSPPPPPPPPPPSSWSAQPAASDPLAAARLQVQAANWPAAMAELRKLGANSDADWNNLMGYVLRKQARPDLDAAQRYYDAALRINPQHQGALEYSGELALMKGDLATAEARLASLSRLCSTPCEPLDDLKKAVARYKAGGKS